jgi:hypothetical protein
VLAREDCGRHGIAALVLAGLDLGADDPGELDVLGRVVRVDVVVHRQIGDGLHWLTLPGEDREDGLAGALRPPSPPR